MLKEKEIKNIFKFFKMNSEEARRKIQSQELINKKKHKEERKMRVITDNVTIAIEDKELKNTELE